MERRIGDTLRFPKRAVRGGIGFPTRFLNRRYVMAVRPEEIERIQESRFEDLIDRALIASYSGDEVRVSIPGFISRARLAHLMDVYRSAGWEVCEGEGDFIGCLYFRKAGDGQ